MTTQTYHPRFCCIRTARCRGTILIITIWIITLLAGMALVFAHTMRIEDKANGNRIYQVQSRELANGSIAYAQALATEAIDTTLAEDPQAIGDDWIVLIKPDEDQDDRAGYGMIDEAGKININTATQEMLEKLPGMTEELAAALIDWRDGNSDVTTNGAEDEYYLLLDEPYTAKNGSLESIDELLLVKGFTRQIIYGEDTNRNGVLDANENDGNESDPPDNADGTLDPGIFPYVTVYSIQSNQNDSGENKPNINNSNLNAVSTALQEELDAGRFAVVMNNVRNNRPFENLIDFYYKSQMTLEEFDMVADKLSDSNNQNVRGKININTAPKRVLQCLPELEEADAETLVTYRSSKSEEELASIGWVTEAFGEDGKEKAIAIGGVITTSSSQYAFDALVIRAKGRSYARRYIVIDTREDAQVRLSQDITHLGWPLNHKVLTALKTDDDDPEEILSDESLK
jgi:type II secretory pathway component PulK